MGGRLSSKLVEYVNKDIVAIQEFGDPVNDLIAIITQSKAAWQGLVPGA